MDDNNNNAWGCGDEDGTVNVKCSLEMLNVHLKCAWKKYYLLVMTLFIAIRAIVKTIESWSWRVDDVDLLLTFINLISFHLIN